MCGILVKRVSGRSDSLDQRWWDVEMGQRTGQSSLVRNMAGSALHDSAAEVVLLVAALGSGGVLGVGGRHFGLGGC